MNTFKHNTPHDIWWVDSIDSLIPAILERYVQLYWLWSFQLIQSGKTMKSVYGKIRFSDWSIRFFKISQAQRIQKEMTAYHTLSNWKHQKIDHVMYLDGLGMYTQDFFEGKYWTCIMEDVCQYLSGESLLTKELIRDECIQIFRWIAEKYETSIHTDKKHGENDIFYKWRTVGDNSWIHWYKNLPLKHQDGSESILQDIYNYPVILNGRLTPITISGMFDELVQHFWSPYQRKMIISQGDLTENNITLDGNFYDFETWGVNALWQDMAITIHYLMIAGHYITPKYSSSAKSLKINLDKLLHSVELPRASFMINNKMLHINFEFASPAMKQLILTEYFRIMQILWCLEEEFENLKKALAFRCIASKNLRSVDACDRTTLLSLALSLYSLRSFEDLQKFLHISPLWTSLK